MLDVDGEVIIYLDASNSSDEDALEGNGIERYEWKVLFDARYDDEDFAIEGHSFEQSAASDGLFAYTFSNITVDEGTSTTQIRIELVVFDGADKYSEKHRMYFEVVEDGFGDEEPDVFLDRTFDGICPDPDSCRIDSDTITVSGQILSGAETEQDVFVEVALSQDIFDKSPFDKYNHGEDGEWKKSPGLGNLDPFNLTLSLNGMYSNKSLTVLIYIKTYEGDAGEERFIKYDTLEITLPACQGLEANLSAEEAGGEFVLDADGDCQWSGAWTFVDGEWKAPQTDNGDDATKGSLDGFLIPGLVALALVMIVILTLVFMRKGSGDDTKDFSVTDSGFGGVVDQTEQYVQ
jgi:hypothetical protein